MNWSQIYRSEVAPILENFASGPPVWVYAIVGILAATGIALIVWAPMKVKLGGAVLIFFCGFIGFMAFRSSRVKTDEPAEFRTGLILKKYEKKQVVRKTTGIMEPEITYWIDFYLVPTWLPKPFQNRAKLASKSHPRGNEQKSQKT